MKKIISIVLILCICFSLCIPGLASTVSNMSDMTLSVTVDVSMTIEESIVLAYKNLSPEARQIFDYAISFSPDIIAYHTQYVDPNYEIPQVSIMSTSAYPDAIQIINTGLSNLALPTAVKEALTLLASGISAALADGPILAGDIYALAIAGYTAVIIAAHWDDIMNLWGDIVEIFEDAYSSIRGEVTDSMESVEADIEDEYSLPDILTVSITASNRTFRIGDRYYVCSKSIEEFSPVGQRFYPGVVKNGLYVCPTYISFKAARALMEANISLTGVLTRYSGVAQSLGSTIGSPEIHGQETHIPYSPNLMHYHIWLSGGRRSETHAWFVS